MSESKAVAEKAMLDRMNVGPFTFLEIYAAGNLACGFAAGDQSTFCYRLADRLMQRERKAGRISFTREGRQAVWSKSHILKEEG